ncbi:MAG: sulfotransferase domain-containing protein [Pseudomonadales bacterium]|nr:sulfotransferase domain-containing protein [Pseudomonadales bacterium]MCP5185558.1 sulfotransferase domain-containing protein [Pseudomonadales bacterium]
MSVDMRGLRDYRNAVEDNGRWADFEPRPDDIVICTPPKCGTTWTQTIVASLLWPAGDQPAAVGDLSIWIDARFSPAEDMHRRLRAQTHRRFLKTHTPADGIPWFDTARYLYVARDGRDAFMSMCNHQARMRQAVKDRLNAQVQDEPGVRPLPAWDGDVHGFFANWLAGFGHLEHVRGYWDRRHQPNLLLVHYNDLKADLGGQMQRIADFLGINVPQHRWSACVERCTFEAMQRDEARMGSFDQFDGGIRGFIFQGTNGRWKDILTAEELAAYDSAVRRELPAEAARWLESGSLTAG